MSKAKPICPCFVYKSYRLYKGVEFSCNASKFGGASTEFTFEYNNFADPQNRKSVNKQADQYYEEHCCQNYKECSRYKKIYEKYIKV